MEHQSWDPVALQKKVKTEKNAIPIQTHIPDDEDKKIKWFTPAMGKKIQQLRMAKQLTQEQLARSIQVHTKIIIDIERGKELYSGMLVSKLKRVLGNFSW